MKKVLLASSALVLSAGVAAAEVSVGGDGRMGVIDTFGDSDLTFTSRIRISFSASGETDGGLAFGGSIRADNSAGQSCVLADDTGLEPGDVDFDVASADITCAGLGGVTGQAGSVFIEGGFGKLSMGDVDGAAKAAVGHVSGVGLTGLGDLNESTYLANVGPDLPGALYEYSTGDLTVYASADRPDASDVDAYAFGMSYGFGDYTVALGYEDVEDADHIIGGITAGFGDATVKAVYGTADLAGVDFDQYSVSLDYVMGATSVTAFYNHADAGGAESDAYGIGASYDLGGGASLKGGYVSTDSGADDDDAFDFGISMSF